MSEELDTKEFPKMLYKDGKGTIAHNPAEEKAFLKLPPKSAADTGDGEPVPETPAPKAKAKVKG